MSEDVARPLLTDSKDKLDGLGKYIDGKMKRYSLLFAVNGGAFAVAKLIGDPESQIAAGALSFEALAVGAALFTALMCTDIFLFGHMMRTKFFGNEIVFDWPGKLILVFLGLLIIGGWGLAGFGPEPSKSPSDVTEERVEATSGMTESPSTP